jgi:hypothetical protein
MTASAQIGSATSKDRPTSNPKKLAGVTPMISKGRSASVSLRPMMFASPPYSRSQKRWLMTTPGAPQPR